MDDYIDAMRRGWAALDPELSTASGDTLGRMARISRIVQVQTDAILVDHGISRDEFDLLSLLVRAGGPLTPTALARALWVSASGTTKRLHKLEASGLIVRRVHPSDARAVLIEPSDTALDAIRPVLHARAVHEDAILATMSRGARIALGNTLRELLVALEGEYTGAAGSDNATQDRGEKS
ncbi:MarR family winged helix-turn-helix transcriptional regulator [Curtobacterium sp. VKM Ac-1376]|uniref:MarR family winged helix-turn-helix transcriptional regulator n=1 Tax=Curtobacterium sp. VKM Ac-1376 TaxID=123312 RepID=UPI00188C7D3D|nr:MarR family transcriptional regulator [Curtobacterium sp. VKM Ac-1376]MBF4613350.1 MarR family transcriptional regulator [Curtobacterium sp. VKM Ac-1376]